MSAMDMGRKCRVTCDECQARWGRAASRSRRRQEAEAPNPKLTSTREAPKLKLQRQPNDWSLVLGIFLELGSWNAWSFCPFFILHSSFFLRRVSATPSPIIHALSKFFKSTRTRYRMWRERATWDGRWRMPNYRPRWLSDAPRPFIIAGVESGRFAAGMTLLEIGCGLGTAAAWLAQRGLH